MRWTEIAEKAPPKKKAHRFIRKAKADFKKRYGDAWKHVLYATAWKMFGESLNEMDAPQDFDSWFKGSKVVNAKGEPIVMYHGTPHENSDFNEFDTGTMGSFFTSDPDYAQAYAEKPINDDPANNTGAIFPVFLRLVNPLIVDHKDEEEFDKYRYHGWTIADLERDGYDGMMVIYDDEIEAMVCRANQVVSAVAAKKGTSPNLLRDLNEDDALMEDTGQSEKLVRTQQNALYEVWRSPTLALVGGMRVGSSPAGLIRGRYSILDLAAMAEGVSQDDATMGYVDLFTNGNNFEGLVNIKLDTKKRRAGIGARVIRALLATIDVPEFKIHDIKKGALGFWKKMGCEFYYSDFKKPIPKPREYKGTIMGIIRKGG